MAGNRLQHLTANDWVLIPSKTSRRTFKLGEEVIQKGGGGGDMIFMIRHGQVSVELAGTGTRAIVASLGRDDICGEMAFLEQGRATAAVIAKQEEVEVDEVGVQQWRAISKAFPGLAFRCCVSLAVILARRLRVTSKELAREMTPA
jgi:CRP-like cAMP-binding protein